MFSPPPRISNTFQLQSDTFGRPEDSSRDDPFNPDSDDGGSTTDDENLRRNTSENSGSSHGQDLGRWKALSSQSNRTVASTPLVTVGNGRAIRNPTVEPKSKPQYNVDEFTKLLLTGKKPSSDSTPPVPPSASSQTIQAAAGDSSSNTDASSISRQSIFEPPPDARQDTPRTSRELSSSDEERQQLRGSPLSAREREKPVTPQSHHGKPVVDNTTEMEAHKETASPIASSRTNEAFFGPLRLGSLRTPTDLNKPLPSPPTSQASGPLVSNAVEFSTQPKRSQQLASPSRRKEPPAPPSARRQGPWGPKQSLDDPRRFVGQTEPDTPKPPQPNQISPEQSMLISDSTVKPPPPPPRRPGPIRGLSTSSTTSGVSMVPTPSSSNFSDDSNLTKSRPPLPPTRDRSSSATKRQIALPTQAGSTALPPVPPPRRRGSSQSSFSPARLSGEYQSSLTGRQRTDSGASSVQSKDVMADLSTLQREVDALRGKFGT